MHYLTVPKTIIDCLCRISLVRSKKGLQQDGFDFETQTELDIKCLQTLRAMIYNEIIQIDDEELRNKNPEQFRK